jgi:ribokinase
MARVTVVGSVNMDLVVRAARFPRAGETMLGRTFQAIPGGKGANQPSPPGAWGPRWT